MEINQDLIQLLAKPVLQEFIFTHEADDERDLVLRHKEIKGVPAPLVADQIKGRRKAKAKLPSWYNVAGIVYPPSVNLEQSSSEVTASFKASIVKESQSITHSMCDLTGGFGTDTYFFSKVFREIDYVEPNNHLLEIAKHNLGLLGATNITYLPISAENLLYQQRGIYDFIFVDPSRRNKTQNKLTRLQDCEPDVVRLQPRWFERADQVLIKASPLLDIQQALKELKNVKSCFVVCVNNECKELLFLCVKNFNAEPVVHCVDLSTHTAPLLVPRTDRFSFSFSEEQSATADSSEPRRYLYEPYTSILKAGAFKLIAQRYKLSKIHPNTHLYTTDDVLSHFPGLIFEINELAKLDKKLTEKFPRGQANILIRNYPITVEEIRKKTGLTDGGHLYLICCSGEREKWVMIASRIR